MVVSLRKISKRTGLNPHYIRGRSDGMGIRLEPVGPALVMSDADYDRLVAALRADGFKIPEDATAAAT